MHGHHASWAYQRDYSECGTQQRLVLENDIATKNISLEQGDEAKALQSCVHSRDQAMCPGHEECRGALGSTNDLKELVVETQVKDLDIISRIDVRHWKVVKDIDMIK